MDEAIKNIVKKYKNSERIEDLVKMSKEIKECISNNTNDENKIKELKDKYSKYFIDFHY